MALCSGWIDGIARRLDDQWYVQRFPRDGQKSVCSKINRERIERLTAEERMRPAGRAEVETARADGRWHAAYDSPATAVVPDYLAAALAARDLTEVYASLDSRNRFAVLNRIQTAVRPETRTRRIEQLTDDLAQGRTPYSAPTKTSGTLGHGHKIDLRQGMAVCHLYVRWSGSRQRGDTIVRPDRSNTAAFERRTPAYPVG